MACSRSWTSGRPRLQLVAGGELGVCGHLGEWLQLNGLGEDGAVARDTCSNDQAPPPPSGIDGIMLVLDARWLPYCLADGKKTVADALRVRLLKWPHGSAASCRSIYHQPPSINCRRRAFLPMLGDDLLQKGWGSA